MGVGVEKVELTLSYRSFLHTTDKVVDTNKIYHSVQERITVLEVRP